MRDLAISGNGWRVPPNPTPPDTSLEDVAWPNERRVYMPLKCFETKFKLEKGRSHCRAATSMRRSSRR
jgi:hypothetical protein